MQKTWRVRSVGDDHSSAVFLSADGPREAAEEWLRRRHCVDPSCEEDTVCVWLNGRGQLSSSTWDVEVEMTPVYRARPRRGKA